jgi:peptide chain release factor 1
MRGTGPGGQHRNKTESAVRVTHLPTGVSAYADERSQKQSKRKALRELDRRLAERRQESADADKKARRDAAIRERSIIRTYDYSRDTVKDHRTGKTASIKNVLDKGRIDLIAPEAR